MPSLLERDAGLVWHPYAPLSDHGASSALAEVHDARGAQLRLRPAGAGEPRWVVDAMSSWWAGIHGYRHPVLDAAARAQIDAFSHVMFGGLTHEPAVALAERLRALSPGTAHVFLADSGSVSVEVALKLAMQYAQATHRPQRTRMVALRGGYHGDTTGAMAVTDPDGAMHHDFNGLLASHIFLPRPPAADAEPARVRAWAEEARRTVTAHAEEIAGIICEPLVQGAGGMHFYHPDCLRVLRELATQIDAVFIADEIATGFRRAGTMFACESVGVTPDVRCVGKALTGGYLSLAAVLVSAPVGEVISDSPHRALMHGPTFMGNPLACAVACASLDLIDDDAAAANVSRIETGLRAALAPAADLAQVVDVRVKGAIGVVETAHPVQADAVSRVALEHGVWVRPFRRTVYTMPPYISTDEEVARIGAGIVSALAETGEGGR